MHHGVLAVTVVEETIVCTAGLLGKTSGGYLTVDALKESLTVKITIKTICRNFRSRYLVYIVTWNVTENRCVTTRDNANNDWLGEDKCLKNC